MLTVNDFVPIPLSKRILDIVVALASLVLLSPLLLFFSYYLPWSAFSIPKRVASGFIVKSGCQVAKLLNFVKFALVGPKFTKMK